MVETPEPESHTDKAHKDAENHVCPYVTDVALATTTDNPLVIDLQGSPAANSNCSNTPGSPQWCYNQSYKAHQYAQNPKGNIIWNTQIWCGATVNPDIYGSVPQSFTCK